jgi:hypothetical protein
MPVVADDDDEPVNVNVPPQQIPQQQTPGIAPFPGTGPPVAPFATPTPQIEGSQPRFQPGMLPTQQPGQQAVPPPMTSPRPGLLPQPPNGVQNPYQQPGVVRPGGPGGEGGERQ